MQNVKDSMEQWEKLKSNPPRPPLAKGGEGGFLTSRTIESSNPAQDGFTLLELIVSIAIFAIISSFVYGAYTGIDFTTSKVQKKIEFYQKARLILDRISNELEQAATPPTSDATVNYFIGTSDMTPDGKNADTLEFISRVNTSYVKESNKPSLTRIYYSLEVVSDSEEKEDYFSLVRKEDPFFYRQDEMPEYGSELKGVEFLAHCEGINFEYYSGDAWLEDWDDQETPPQMGKTPKAVRITLTLKDDEGQNRDLTTTVHLPQGN